ncbi:MAG TPA: DUF167 domain-containing protein [Jatrophihabitantaceae bacterium]|nr:DUF167 domain-containing protein [Jatrophihabitantaceae bacterium]
MDSTPFGLRIAVRVRPGASRTSVGGRYGDAALVVTVSARPVDGQANRAVVEAIAAAFGLRRSAVTLLTGQLARDKVLFVAGDPELLGQRLAALQRS